MTTKISLLLCALLLAGSLTLQGQYREVRRGERPPIDLSAVPPGAYDPGVIRIKLHKDLERWMDQHPFSISEEGVVRFGIPALDALHQAYQVEDASETFRSRALENRYAERHRLWGFHLWYDLHVSEDTDIIAMVQAYKALDEVEVAEPHYRKELIGDIHLGLEPPRYDENWQIIDADDPWDNGLSGQQEAWQRGGGQRDEETDPLWPDDPQFGNQWHYHNTGQANGTPGADISLPEAWSISTGANEVIVAVIDGGIRLDHEDIQGSIWDGIGYNFYLDTTLILGTHHGTHVGGTIGARNNNDIGVSGVAGGWGEETGAKLMSLQVFLGIGGQGFHLAPIFAADNGAAISQNSWGYSVPDHYEQAVLDAIDYFNVNGGGDVLDGGITITSSGNSSSNQNFYPGYYSGTMAVAATNNKDQRAGYSNYGHWIDISAPGGEVSPLNQGGVLSLTTSGYSYSQGTSMACPHVSGVAALMLSIAPMEFTAHQLQSLLEQSADNIDAENPNHIGEMGAGRLNAYQALLLAQENIFSVGNFSVETENMHRALLSWTPNTHDHKVMLAWNKEDVFGEPQWDLQVGDSIEGGGTVLYRGHATAFSHVMPAEFHKHHYRIWAVNEEGENLSRSRAVMAEREVAVKNIPLQEIFDHAFWPAAWDTLKVQAGEGTGNAPEISLRASGSNPTAAPSTGNHMVAFNSFQARHNASARLVSTPISTKGLSAASLELDWHHHASLSNVNDRVTVQLSRNKENWTTIGVLSRYKEDAGWESYQYSLSSHFLDRDTIYLGFLFQAARTGAATGGNMYLDNVRMYTGEEAIFPDFTVSAHQAQVGERIVVTNRSNGSGIHKMEWHFGENAWPAHAQGAGPHEVIYLESGSYSVSLLINDTIMLTKEDLITIHPATHPAPQGVVAELADGDHVALDWSWTDGQETASGFNVYRNGVFLENIPDPAVRSFHDADVPEGWLTYLVRAYFAHPHEVSPPGVSNKVATNAVEVLIETQGLGTTNPPPGLLPFLQGDTLLIEALPGDNHIFLHWMVDGEGQLGENPAEIPIQGDTQVVAVFQDATSVDELHPAAALSVYPNPNSGGFTVTSGSVIEHIRLVSTTGQIVYSHRPSQPKEEVQLNAGHLPAGIYQLVVTSRGGQQGGRIVIMR